ncbi:hypothetical protein PFICI_07505 [Pestalotiopsis fici W106-1]|uniref:NACHT domain-containing protein n=1 Tax=Pestalotiopsis fici (strain W106-1 / CGMCC3.15140) TaxID=1229662 RepID=W3X473_PESFW|nr:uncharacterized protein PFICI_07505 [Pestalotiopsis fici W106-1]ETS79976.1 hypothetical protein PFICI_07505 [Pestalotiopsis fici W106-1]
MKNFARQLKGKIAKVSSGRGDGDGDAGRLGGTIPPIGSTRPELYGMFHLTETASSQPASSACLAKVIAVHGLNGDAFTTWTHSNGTLWLRDCLPASIPGCQVYTYGYPSQIFTTSYAGVRDYARHLLSCVRDLHELDHNEEPVPIIFVCHSLGGIVCKQALVLAHEDDVIYRSTLKSVLGVVFLGTPHKGSEAADIGKIVGRIINLAVPKATRTDLLGHLGENSQALRELASSFRHRLCNLEVVTFYETQPIPPLSSLVVERSSSILDIPQEDIIPLYENHRDICRFSGHTTSYKAVSSALRRIVTRAEAKRKTSSKEDARSSQRSFNEIEKGCVTLFSPFDIDDYHRRIPKPIKSTFLWVISHPVFVSWLKTAKSTMIWFTGYPGSGKTVMSSFLTRYLERTAKAAMEDAMVCVYFCDGNINKQKDARSILLGVIFQIIRQHRSLIQYVRKFFEIQGVGLAQSLSALWRLFLELTRDPKSDIVYVVLDALDECENRTCNELLALVYDFLEESKSPSYDGSCVKFILTSRPAFIHSRGRMNSLSKYCFALDDGQQGYDEDIRTYIQERVKEIAGCPPGLREHLQTTLQTKAGSTFLWVHQVFRALEGSFITSHEAFQSVINAIPATLEMTYQTFLAAIPQNESDTANRLLQLMLGSMRPLTIAEISIAFTITWNHQDADQLSCSAPFSMLRTLQLVLGPLVRISESKVSLLHQTVKEFLLNPAMCAKQYVMTAEECALCMSMACARYLLLSDFVHDAFAYHPSPDMSLTDSSSESGSSKSDHMFTASFWADETQLGSDRLFKEQSVVTEEACKSIEKEYPFYRYAALHWASHYSVSEKCAPPRMRKAARDLLNKTLPQCANWWRFYQAEADGMNHESHENLDTLELAAYFNFSEMLRDILEEQDFVDANASKCRALFWASFKGNVESIRILLHAGTDPTFRSFEQQTALTIAAEKGHKESVVVLLEHPHTNINCQGRRGRSALSFAAANGHHDIVRLLLANGEILPDQVDENGCTALIWAISGGDTQIVQDIVDHNSVNVNHQDETGRTAVSWAAGEGKTDILKKLLKDKRADMNISDKRGLSPLIWATRLGQTQTVRLLVRSKEVRVDTVDKDLRGPISWACGQGHHEVLRILIKYRCPGINQKDVDGWSPIAWAIQCDAPEIIETLLLTGEIDLEANDGNGKTALWWAVSYGHIRNVKTLLREGANPKARTKDGVSVIDVARDSGRSDIVTELSKAL